MKNRILSGMRPTGRLHLGNYTVVENWVNLQNKYENFHMVADWHMLTTKFEDLSQLKANSVNMVIDWVSSGIDPEKSPIFVQSHVKEHAELHLLLSMLVTTARLERNPTVKEQVRDLGLEDRISYGLLGYPVLQAADILLYRADTVPVGEDQLPHIEISREIARRFNYVYGVDIFPEPKGIVTAFGRLPGLDGSRMSKSAGNTIEMSESVEDIGKKVMRAVTDPQKIRRNDPGHPEVCTVFTYHKKYNPAEIPEIEPECKSGALGCVACKRNLAAKLADYLAPIREKRGYYEAHPDEIHDIINDGDKRARKEAEETMSVVRDAMNLD